jgi:hypothetical protein
MDIVSVTIFLPFLKHQYPSNMYDDLAANSSIMEPRDVK